MVDRINASLPFSGPQFAHLRNVKVGSENDLPMPLESAISTHCDCKHGVIKALSSNKQFQGKGAGGGGGPSCHPEAAPTAGLLSLPPAGGPPRRAICTLCLSGLRKKYPCHIGLASPLFAENLLTDAAPSPHQYFQNVQVSKQDLTGWVLFC